MMSNYVSTAFKLHTTPWSRFQGGADTVVNSSRMCGSIVVTNQSVFMQKTHKTVHQWTWVHLLPLVKWIPKYAFQKTFSHPVPSWNPWLPMTRRLAPWFPQSVVSVIVVQCTSQVNQDDVTQWSMLFYFNETIQSPQPDQIWLDDAMIQGITSDCVINLLMTIS